MPVSQINSLRKHVPAYLEVVYKKEGREARAGLYRDHSLSLFSSQAGKDRWKQPYVATLGKGEGCGAHIPWLLLLLGSSVGKREAETKPGRSRRRESSHPSPKSPSNLPFAVN